MDIDFRSSPLITGVILFTPGENFFPSLKYSFNVDDKPRACNVDISKSTVSFAAKVENERPKKQRKPVALFLKKTK
ncbi:hypothetical protein D3C86_1639100 [compost metagenome]